MLYLNVFPWWTRKVVDDESAAVKPHSFANTRRKQIPVYVHVACVHLPFLWLVVSSHGQCAGWRESPVQFALQRNMLYEKAIYPTVTKKNKVN